MEDIQDGIKKSIQDGVEEDPEAEKEKEIAHKSFAGLIYVSSEIGNLTMDVTPEGTLATPHAITMATSVAGVVT